MYIYISLPDGGHFQLPSICLSPPPALLKIYLKHLAGRTTHEEGVESVKFLNFKLYIASVLPTFVSPWAISVPQSKKRRYYSSIILHSNLWDTGGPQTEVLQSLTE